MKAIKVIKRKLFRYYSAVGGAKFSHVGIRLNG